MRAIERNHVKGKIGQGKLRYERDKLRSRTKATSYCAINLIHLAMNMIALQKRALYSFFSALKHLMEYNKVIFGLVKTNCTYQNHFC